MQTLQRTKSFLLHGEKKITSLSLRSIKSLFVCKLLTEEQKGTTTALLDENDFFSAASDALSRSSVQGISEALCSCAPGVFG